MPTDRTNVLLITSDQHHWSSVGFQNPEVRTPNLDRLAAQGTIYDRAYTVNPTCTPTRASMFTGLYPSQHGAYSLGTKLPESVPTIGDTLTENDVRSALVGKAHFQPLRGTEEYPSLESYPVMQDLGFWRNFSGPFYGFEHCELARNHVDEAHVGQHYAIWMEERGLTNWRDYYLAPTGNATDQRWHWPIPEEFHYDAWIAERTNALLEQYARDGEDFLLYSSFFDPHPGYLVPEPYDTMYDPAAITMPSLVPGEHENNPPHFQMTQEARPDFSPWRVSGQGLHGFHSHLHDEETMRRNVAVYYGMVTLMDKYIGVILDKLDELGLTEKTLVAFSTDHGHLFGQHGMIAKGAFHYDDLIRVPYVVRQPGRIAEGKRSDSLQSLVDLSPSFLSAMGIDVPRAMTGIDQTPCWYGEEESVRDHCIVENRHEPDTIHVKTLVTQQHKLTVYYKQEYGELFDLEADPNEVSNLWNDPASQELKQRLTRELLDAEMGKEPVWMPRIWGA